PHGPALVARRPSRHRGSSHRSTRRGRGSRVHRRRSTADGRRRRDRRGTPRVDRPGPTDVRARGRNAHGRVRSGRAMQRGAGNGRGVTRQWDASTGKEVSPALEGQVGQVTGVGYSRDGRILATTTIGLWRTRLWEMPGGRSIGAELVGGRVPYTTRTVSIEH